MATHLGFLREVHLGEECVVVAQVWAGALGLLQGLGAVASLVLDEDAARPGLVARLLLDEDAVVPLPYPGLLYLGESRAVLPLHDYDAAEDA